MKFDKRQIRRAFGRAAARYDATAVLQQEIGDRLLERLDYVRLEPRTVLDLGTGTGRLAQALLRRYRRARVVGLDIALPMLAEARRRGGRFRRPALVCGDMERLPFADGSADLILSSLTLQWCQDARAVFAEFARVLRPGGALFFTTFGPDTLKELRQSWAEVDDRPHVADFADMHDLGDALLAAGLAQPVMDREDLLLTYRDLPALLRDIRDIGAHNAATGRPRGLTGKGRWRDFEAAYERRRDNGVLPATYEVLYGHAWAPERPAPQPRPDGSVVVPFPGARW